MSRCKRCDWSHTAGSIYRSGTQFKISKERTLFLRHLPDETYICSQCFQDEQEVLTVYRREEALKKLEKEGSKL